jgi:hypothetical protein
MHFVRAVAAAVLLALAPIGTWTISSASAQACLTQPNGSLVCTCGFSAVNQGQCCPANSLSPPQCIPNCSSCAPNNPNCCDPAIVGYACTCLGPFTTATAPLSYYLFAVTYEPPGNMSTALYLHGTSVGSQVQVQYTNAVADVAQITAGPLQISASYMYGGITGNVFQMTSNGSWGPQITSNTDLINHLNDKFWIWTNVQMTATNQDNNYTSSLQPPAGQLVNVLDVSVGELTGQFPLPAYKAAQLANLSASDKAAILKTNPYVTANNTIDAKPKLDPKRFKFLQEHYTVSGPDYLGDPASGYGFDTNNQNIHGIITGQMQQTQVTVQAGGTFSFITDVMVFAGLQWQYTWQKTTQSNTGTITDAQGLLESSTLCWHQGVDLYWDSAFGTYLFHPTNAGSSDCNNLPGIVGIIDGELGNILKIIITATMPDGTKWRTSVNKNGEFKFYDLPPDAGDGVRISVPEGHTVDIRKFNGRLATDKDGFHVDGKGNEIVISVPKP